MTEFQIPPHAILDLLEPTQFAFVDPVVCPILGSLGGTNLANALLIQYAGDVYLSRPLGSGYYWVYDCAPYGDHFGSDPIVGNPLAGSDGLITLLLPPLL